MQLEKNLRKEAILEFTVAGTCLASADFVSVQLSWGPRTKAGSCRPQVVHGQEFGLDSRYTVKPLSTLSRE